MVQSSQPAPRRQAPFPAGALPPMPATASWIAARRADSPAAMARRPAGRGRGDHFDPSAECRCPDACLRDHPNE